MLLFASAAALVVSVSTSAVERKLLPALVLLAAAGRFSLTGAAAFTHRESWVNAAGVAGFVLAAIAFSGAFAIELRSALSR